MNYVLTLVSAVGSLPAVVLYVAIFVWLIVESCGAPIPNEAVLLFAGYLVAIGHLALVPAWIAASLGSLGGATVSWYVAKRFGPAGVRRFGRYVLLDEARLSAAQHWADRWGHYAVFLARLIPVVRTVASYPAGLAQMPYQPFALATILGAAVWCMFVLLVGREVGPAWVKLFDAVHLPFLVVGIVIVLVLLAYLLFEAALKRRLRTD